MIFSKWNRHDNPVVSIECARVKKSIIYVTVRKQKAPINMLSHSKAPKTQQNCCYIHKSKTSGLNDTTRVSTLASSMIFLTWVPLQKLPFLFSLQFLDWDHYRLADIFCNIADDFNSFLNFFKTTIVLQLNFRTTLSTI